VGRDRGQGIVLTTDLQVVAGEFFEVADPACEVLHRLSRPGSAGGVFGLSGRGAHRRDDGVGQTVNSGTFR